MREWQAGIAATRVAEERALTEGGYAQIGGKYCDN